MPLELPTRKASSKSTIGIRKSNISAPIDIDTVDYSASIAYHIDQTSMPETLPHNDTSVIEKSSFSKEEFSPLESHPDPRPSSFDDPQPPTPPSDFEKEPSPARLLPLGISKGGIAAFGGRPVCRH
ncbi:hypothetical protein EJ02DRAFT_423201 [Clathrospora elynae]|uniref:Uncharacterized protein n=1 Tax=Clathrospora elynae TaxID=706981 RepID=A0A6A5SKP1_9PLEO|nr:hypothetical protein EJ02DRAFT_423201 [Clathrospora elynae]